MVLPLLELKFGPDGQNPPDEVMEQLENDKYYRYCTYAATSPRRILYPPKREKLLARDGKET